MLRIGVDLLHQRKQGDFGTASGENSKRDWDEKEPAKDLLTVLVKANQDTELPDSQRMSDEEVIARKCDRNSP